MCHKIFVIILLYIFSSITYSQEKIIVSANRINTSLNTSGDSVVLITQSEIEKSNYSTVYDLIKNIPGISFSNSGGAGQNSSIFIQGADSGHTLVILDGIELNDPSTPNRSFDFSTLTLDNVESIEVIKGSQSVLYGSDAIGGVIKITTRKSRDHRTITRLNFGYGSYNSYVGNLGLQNKYDKYYYSVSSEMSGNEGFSSAKGGIEKDGHLLKNISARMGTEITNHTQIELVGRYTKSKVEIDNGGNAENDDLDRINLNEKFYGKFQARSVFLDGLLEPTLFFTYSKNNRSDKNPPEVNKGKGILSKAACHNNILVNKNNTTSIGVEFEEEKDKSESITLSKHVTNIWSFFIHHHYQRDNVFLNIGSRLDRHAIFGGYETYKISPGYKIKKTNTTLKGSISSGFKAPSLNQLFTPLYGNISLKPEKSLHYQATLEQYIHNKHLMAVSFFKTKIKNRFSYNPQTFQNINAGKATVWGIEIMSKLLLIKDLHFRVYYTRLRTLDHFSQKQLMRRPSSLAGINISYKYPPELNLIVNTQYVGKRDDYDATSFERVSLDDYLTIDLSINYALKKQLTFWLKINNLMNADYEEIDGYNTPGRSGMMGIKLKI